MNTNHDDKHGMRSRANQLIGILKEQRVVEKWREYCHYWTITIALQLPLFSKSSDWQDLKKSGTFNFDFTQDCLYQFHQLQ